MSWQLAVVLMLVVAAGAYLLRATWTTWAGKRSGCGSGCGKCAKPATDASVAPKGRIALPQV